MVGTYPISIQFFFNHCMCLSRGGGDVVQICSRSEPFTIYVNIYYNIYVLRTYNVHWAGILLICMYFKTNKT